MAVPTGRESRGSYLGRDTSAELIDRHVERDRSRRACNDLPSNATNVACIDDPRLSDDPAAVDPLFAELGIRIDRDEREGQSECEIGAGMRGFLKRRRHAVDSTRVDDRDPRQLGFSVE